MAVPLAATPTSNNKLAGARVRWAEATLGAIYFGILKRHMVTGAEEASNVYTINIVVEYKITTRMPWKYFL